MLPKPTLTRFVRIRPVTWETGIALRFEVYGCKISGGYRRAYAYVRTHLGSIFAPQLPAETNNFYYPGYDLIKYQMHYSSDASDSDSALI